MSSELPEDASLPNETITSIIKNASETVLNGKQYQHDLVSQWIEQIHDLSIKDFQSLKLPFKFILTTLIVENKESSVHIYSTAKGNRKSDGKIEIQYSNSSLNCLVTVYCIKV
ncbi:putative dynein light chain Tctex-type 1 [Monocercomonoides exilis]|uniref:putative dynein light chain Tctex-type 1 n=1 Tax=Monocercomonoides exilis TaxID=2049356 RepID=UPI00355A4030|nr:putative dynein light chain Tctex-type 1 [Monocercomonoides exilis]